LCPSQRLTSRRQAVAMDFFALSIWLMIAGGARTGAQTRGDQAAKFGLDFRPRRWLISVSIPARIAQ